MGKLASVEAALRKAALAYPGAYEEKPWGERVTKVKGKIFVFAGVHARVLHVTTKLPESAKVALMLPFASPTGYGLGKSGWVTARFEDGSDPPLPLLLEWLDESYRAIAPRKLVAEIGQEKENAKAPRRQGSAKSSRKKTGKASVVLLVGDDELRLARAREALVASGAKTLTAAPTDEALGLASRKRPQAIVIDLGRRPDHGLELGSALARSPVSKTPVFFAGARDAATKRRVEKLLPGNEGCFREPPGDPAVVGKVAARLGAR